jgi:hypothetical protein
MDTKTADRILAAVGEDNFPTDVDRAALVRGLGLCAEWYREAERYSTDRAEDQRARRTALVSKTAKRLHQLLVEDNRDRLYAWDSLFARISKDGPDPRAVLNNIIQLAERVLHEHDDGGGPAKAYQRSFRKWSPFEWLVGRWLPLVYIELDLINPGNLKGLIAKDSPFQRFIVASLAELDITNSGKPYSRDSIVKAISLPFTGQVRRKGAESAKDHYGWWRRQLLLKTMKPHLFPDDET